MTEPMTAPEVRTFTVRYGRSTMGRTEVSYECPWCGTTVRTYMWSLCGSGKRCPNTACRSLADGYGRAREPEPKPEPKVRRLRLREGDVWVDALPDSWPDNSKRHIIRQGGLVTSCGASASTPDVWRPNTSKPRCEACMDAYPKGRR